MAKVAQPNYGGGKKKEDTRDRLFRSLQQSYQSSYRDKQNNINQRNTQNYETRRKQVDDQWNKQFQAAQNSERTSKKEVKRDAFHGKNAMTTDALKVQNMRSKGYSEDRIKAEMTALDQTRQANRRRGEEEWRKRTKK